MATLHRHKDHTALSTRIYFILGNMTAFDDSKRIEISSSPSNIDLICRQLEHYGEADEDLLIKAIRLFANLCINENIGAALCQQDCVQSLLELLKVKDICTSEELVLNIVATLNNVSFYSNSENKCFQNRLQIAELLIPLLLHDNMEAVIETARVFGNFSRFDDVQELMHARRGRYCLTSVKTGRITHQFLQSMSLWLFFLTTTTEMLFILHAVF